MRGDQPAIGEAPGASSRGVFAAQWERMFGLLQAFHEREGRANGQKRHVEEGGEALGARWRGWLEAVALGGVAALRFISNYVVRSGSMP